MNNSTSTEWTPCSKEQELLNHLALALIVLTTAIGLGGNLLCLAAFRYQYKVQKETPYIHQCSIVIADIITIVAGVLNYYQDSAWNMFCGDRTPNFPTYFVALLMSHALSITFAANMASSLLLLVTCLDRIRALTQILDYQLIDQRKCAIWANLISYGVSVVICAYPYNYAVVVINGEFMLQGRNGVVAQVNRGVFIVLRILIVIALSVAMIKLTRVYKKTMKERKVKQVFSRRSDDEKEKNEMVTAKSLQIVITIQVILTVIGTSAQTVNSACWLGHSLGLVDYVTCVVNDVAVWGLNAPSINFNFLFFLCISSNFRGLLRKAVCCGC